MSVAFDFRSPEFLNDPYPYYKKMREMDTPLWVTQSVFMSSKLKGIWFFTRYEDAVSILKQSTVISNNILKVRQENDTMALFMHMLNSDGVEHKRLRGLVSQYFTPSYIKNIESSMHDIIEEILDDMEDKKRINIISEFAEMIPFRVIACIIGIPSSDMPQIRLWLKDVGDGFDTMLITEDIMQTQHKALGEFLVYMRTLLNDETQFPEGSMLRSLLQAVKEGQLSENELLGMIALILSGGHETTIGLIGNGLWLLLSHQEQWNMLIRNPDMIPAAIEEVLRFESPLQRSNFRVATEDIDINGFTVKRGEQISVVISSANRDENVFVNADHFDICRDSNPHIAFGSGVHNCLGKQLARVEVKIAFEKIIERFPDMQLCSDVPKWRANSYFRTLDELWVTSTVKVAS